MRIEQDLGQVADLIERTAVEVAAQEDELRQLLIELIETGREDVAVLLLHSWNTEAAGDVLKTHAELRHEQTRAN